MMRASNVNPRATTVDIGDPRLPERFWAKVRVNDQTGCWEWSRYRDSGYGVYRHGGAVRRAHRVAYLVLVGDVPPPLELDHLCRNRACCNPAHLEPVTRGENIRRGVVPQRTRERSAKVTHCPQGHEYTPENTHMQKRDNGWRTRRCRACDRIRHQIGRAS